MRYDACLGARLECIHNEIRLKHRDPAGAGMCEGRGNGAGKIAKRCHVADLVVHEDAIKDAP